MRKELNFYPCWVDQYKAKRFGRCDVMKGGKHSVILCHVLVVEGEVLWL